MVVSTIESGAGSVADDRRTLWLLPLGSGAAPRAVGGDRITSVGFDVERQDEIDNFVVEEGHPHFERVGHAHPVYFDQDIVGHITLDIAVLTS